MSAWWAFVPWAVGLWSGLVIVHGLWRSLARPDPDPERGSGPLR